MRNNEKLNALVWLVRCRLYAVAGKREGSWWSANAKTACLNALPSHQGINGFKACRWQ